MTESTTSGEKVKKIKFNLIVWLPCSKYLDILTVTIKDDDDILPLLLEEFPHLHLSLHTWHELWRKGLQQIEQITHAHQEVRRKKTRAQAQVSVITFTTLWTSPADDRLVVLPYFSQKTGFDISCKLSQLETICLKCQILFSVKKKKEKYFKISSADNFNPEWYALQVVSV